MRFLGNLIWLIFGGLEAALGWALAGLLLCITIIGIPFGIQCLKIGGFVLLPFGRPIENTGSGLTSLIGNILWLIIFGWGLALGHFLAGILFSITIIGIPFGKQHFKLARLALLPFGKTV